MLLSLNLSQGSLPFITYIIRLIFIILSVQTINRAASIRETKTNPLRAKFRVEIKNIILIEHLYFLLSLLDFV